MKLEDIEVGQTVVDKFGNEYVVEIESYDLMPDYLRYTKFVKCVVVQKIKFVRIKKEIEI